MRAGEKHASSLTNVRCQKRGCTKRLTRIALDLSSPDARFCSRRCAGLETPAKRYSSAAGLALDKEDGDVSDAELQEIES